MASYGRASLGVSTKRHDTTSEARFLNSTPVEARAVITKGLNLKITGKNSLIGAGLGEFGGLDWTL